MRTHADEVLDITIAMHRAIMRTGIYEPSRPNIERTYFRLHRELTRLLRVQPEIAYVPAAPAVPGTPRELHVDGTSPSRVDLRKIIPQNVGGVFSLHFLEYLDERRIVQLAFRKGITLEEMKGFLLLTLSGGDGAMMDDTLVASSYRNVVLVAARDLPEGEMPAPVRGVLARLEHDLRSYLGRGAPGAQVTAEELALDAVRPFMRAGDAVVHILLHAPVLDQQIGMIKGRRGTKARELILAGLPPFAVHLVLAALVRTAMPIGMPDDVRQALLTAVGAQLVKHPQSRDRDRAVRELYKRKIVQFGQLPDDLKEAIEAAEWLDALASDATARAPSSTKVVIRAVRMAAENAQFVPGAAALRHLRAVQASAIPGIFDAALFEAIAEGLPEEYERRAELSAFFNEAGPEILRGFARTTAGLQAEAAASAGKVLAKLGEDGARAAREVLLEGITTEGATILLAVLRPHGSAQDSAMLAKYTKHGVATVRREALSLLAAVDRVAADSAVADAFGDVDPSVRVRALSLCAGAGLGRAQIIPLAIDLILRDAARADVDVVCAAIDVVARAAADGALLTDKAEEAFCKLVKPVGLIGRLMGKQSLPDSVLAAGIGALAKFNTPRARKTVEALEKSRDVAIREVVSRSLRPPPPPTAPAPVVEAPAAPSLLDELDGDEAP